MVSFSGVMKMLQITIIIDQTKEGALLEMGEVVEDGEEDMGHGRSENVVHVVKKVSFLLLHFSLKFLLITVFEAYRFFEYLTGIAQMNSYTQFPYYSNLSS